MILAAAMNPEAFSGAQDAIARMRRGDPDALTAMISRYQHRLYRYLLRLVREPAAADDLFQQTWLRVMEKIGRYDARRNFESWLFSVAHNLAVDAWRGKRGESLDDAGRFRRAGRRAAARAGDPDALERLLDFERGAMLAACMHELPAIHREVLTLRFEEDMKLEEIAEVAGIPLSTVKSRLRRALEGLRAAMDARFQEDREHERARSRCRRCWRWRPPERWISRSSGAWKSMPGNARPAGARWKSGAAIRKGLRRLPQPAIPAQLMERTRTRLVQERAAAADRRWDELMLGALALFAWTVGLTFWFVARIVTGGELVIMGANLVRFGTWSAGSTVLVWLTAAVAAIALGRRRRELRRVL
jgi:RNA polymerase sigma-70 factor (ECF subfamily)